MIDFSASTADLWTAQFQAMFLSLMTLTTRLLPAMQANKWGRVITVASSGVRQPIPQLGISNTLRAGIVNWSKTMSLTTAADGITMNVVMPGRIATARIAELDSVVAQRTGKSRAVQGCWAFGRIFLATAPLSETRYRPTVGRHLCGKMHA